MRNEATGSMTWQRKVLIAGLGVGLLFAAAIAVAQVDDLPGFLPADEQVPVPTPASGQKVAVLQIDLRSDDDAVRAELLSQEVIDSFAPKSFARSGGDWEIRIVGEETVTYQIPNPLIAEVENVDDSRTPFRTIMLESLEWTLVVPLYREGVPIEARAIEIVDLTTGATILTVDVRS